MLRKGRGPDDPGPRPDSFWREDTVTAPLQCEICSRPLDDSVEWMSSLDGGAGVHLECFEDQEDANDEEEAGVDRNSD